MHNSWYSLAMRYSQTQHVLRACGQITSCFSDWEPESYPIPRPSPARLSPPAHQVVMFPSSEDFTSTWGIWSLCPLCLLLTLITWKSPLKCLGITTHVVHFPAITGPLSANNLPWSLQIIIRQWFTKSTNSHRVSTVWFQVSVTRRWRTSIPNSKEHTFSSFFLSQPHLRFHYLVPKCQELCWAHVSSEGNSPTNWSEICVTWSSILQGSPRRINSSLTGFL